MWLPFFSSIYTGEAEDSFEFLYVSDFGSSMIGLLLIVDDLVD